MSLERYQGLKQTDISYLASMSRCTRRGQKFTRTEDNSIFKV